MTTNNTHTLVGGGNSTTKKERSSNIELYRILVMLSIVAHHYVVNSGMLDMVHANMTSANSLFFYIFGAWGKVGINCFVLITGYFMCTSSITLRKFLKLYLEVVFYSLIINLIFYATGYTGLSAKSMVFSVFPIGSIKNDFVACFLVFYLFIPYLNALVHALTQRQHQWLILLSLFTFSLLPLFGIEVSSNYVVWFSILFFISSYLRLYPMQKADDTRFWACASISSILLGVASILCVVFANHYVLMPRFGKMLHFHMFLSDSNQLLGLIIAVCTFMWFKSMNIAYSKFINTVAASAFGVLLIHANSNTMRQWLWYDTIDCVGHYDASFYWLYAIGCVLAIYAVCTIIDIIRIKTIETPLLNVTERFCISIYNNLNKKK